MATAKIVLEVSRLEYCLIHGAMLDAHTMMTVRGGFWPPQAHLAAMLERFDILCASEHTKMEFSIEEGIAMSWAVGKAWRQRHENNPNHPHVDMLMEIYKQLPTDGE